jgi:hypothetical protein
MQDRISQVEETTDSAAQLRNRHGQVTWTCVNNNRSGICTTRPQAAHRRLRA